MSKVVKLSDWKKEKEENEAKPPVVNRENKPKRTDSDQLFEEIIKINKEKEEKRKKERLKANKNVKSSYNL